MTTAPSRPEPSHRAPSRATASESGQAWAPGPAPVPGPRSTDESRAGRPSPRRSGGDSASRLSFPLVRAWARRNPMAAAVIAYGLLKLVGLLVFLHLAGDVDVLGSWDGGWYRRIADEGYDPRLVYLPGHAEHSSIDQNSAAFFPLLPGAMSLVMVLTGLGSYGAGLVVSILASFVAAAGVYRVAAHLRGRRTGFFAAALWAVWPGSGVEWAVYSEALFTALAAWTLYLVLTRRWLPAGFLCLVAGLVRPGAAALVAAVALPALAAAVRRRDGVRAPLAAAALAPLGFVGYIGWVGLKAGNPRAFFLLESNAWDHYFDFGGSTTHTIAALLSGSNDYSYPFTTEDLVALGAVLLAAFSLIVLLDWRLPAPLMIFTVLTIALTLTSHDIFGNTSRYLLPAFPLMVPAAAALARLRTRVGAGMLGLAALASGSYAGYVLFVIGIP